ncbi:MAG: hypothetical protein HY747_03670 [Elusimicrobia bacterium]|nr:hypothetical protein [Elusimicrobiota bacterium]
MQRSHWPDIGCPRRGWAILTNLIANPHLHTLRYARCGFASILVKIASAKCVTNSLTVPKTDEAAKTKKTETKKKKK